MYGSGCASFTLHLAHVWDSPPRIGHGLRGPLVSPFAHRRRRGDGVNGNHFIHPISHMSDGLVGVHGLKLALHEIHHSVFSTGTTGVALRYIEDAAGNGWMSGRRFTGGGDENK